MSALAHQLQSRNHDVVSHESFFKVRYVLVSEIFKGLFMRLKPDPILSQIIE
jgi:hypothetical protein